MSESNIENYPPRFPQTKEEMIRRAQVADALAANCRPDNPHFIAFRERAFELRWEARQMEDDQ